MPRTSKSSLTARSSELTLMPSTCLPVVVVLDTSGSMAGQPIRELGEALAQFFADVDADEDARDMCEIAVVEVGGEARVARPFARAREGAEASLDADGATPMGEGVTMALDLIEERKRQYSAKGIRYFQPWLVVLSDGQPTDATSAAEDRVAKLVAAKKLTVFPVATGPDADLARLGRLAGGTKPVRLAGLEFRAFFRWLSASLNVVSRSQPGTGLALPSPFEWIRT